jgi:hypothetical protein
MKIRIGHEPWQKVVLFDPPSRTVVTEDGSVWHVAQGEQEIVELDLFMTPIIEKYTPWEIEDRKSLAMTKGRDMVPYQIEVEDGDEKKYEMFYFYKFTGGDDIDFLKFPDHLLEGVCIKVESSAIRYFLADTLFFDFLISRSSSEDSIAELCRNMALMKKKWKGGGQIQK